MKSYSIISLERAIHTSPEQRPGIWISYNQSALKGRDIYLFLCISRPFRAARGRNTHINLCNFFVLHPMESVYWTIWLLQTECPAVIDSFGWAYYKKNMFVQAVNHLKYALVLSPGNEVVTGHSGLAEKALEGEWQGIGVGPQQRIEIMYKTLKFSVR